MSADRLREAARVLRERAEAARAGRWITDGQADILSPWRFGVRHVATGAGELPEGRKANAAYIATMHPGVGLALADWLDLVGAWLDEGLGLIHSYSNIGDAWADTERQAYRLADLILGAES